MKIGIGYDVHRLVEGRPLILGGVPISFSKGLAGHSDADVLVHAIMDALLGALGLGDIGRHFPDTDKGYEGANSLTLLKTVYTMLVEKKYRIGNIDAIIIAEKPKMAPYIETMKEKIADVLEIEVSEINIKATTEEGLGFTGRGEGIASKAICLIEKERISKQMKLYNTLTRKKENFVPIHEKEISMYVCGPTTYNYIHIGNAHPMIVFDAMRKYFIHLGYDVTFIQNYTDVDDKIINKGKEEGIPALELATTYIKEYEKDAASLGVMAATAHPKVSEHIADIIHLVEGLVEKGLAYEAEGDVYFEVRKYPQYGKLSGRNIDDLQSGARVEVGSIKGGPLDFALWKSAKEGEVSWNSPWGKGRPGWHIECSAMSLKYIKGDTLDIHGGGQDLIFPHHENEIAQSEGFSGKQFVNYWVHNGFITVNKEKMSKSLGNFFLVRDVLKEFSGEVIRYFLLSTHYRSPIDFNDQALSESEKALVRLNRTYEILGNAITEGIDSDKDTLESFFIELEEKIEKALQDDLNTALGFSYFFEAGKEVGKALKENRAGKAGLAKGYSIFKEYLETVFGVLPYEKEAMLLEESEAHNLADDLMAVFIDIRKMARDEKNFAYADKIREALAGLGIEILDTKEGTQWKKK